MKKIRILVVDDQSVVREGVAAILSLQPDFHVVGEAENGIRAVELARKEKPDVILLDMVMPKQDGVETTRQIKAILPNTRILVLTSFAESNRVYQAIKAGAQGYMLKDITRTQLLQSIRDVMNGQTFLHPSIALKVIHDIDHPTEINHNPESLTRRELETLRLIARGLSNQEIAMTLMVHERTIAKYVSSVLNKLHVTNRTQAALYALREGLAPSAA